MSTLVKKCKTQKSTVLQRRPLMDDERGRAKT